ncbi:uncharacterized protein ACJ7VT_015606 isoform 2-T2 [Polymixia lowei]
MEHQLWKTKELRVLKYEYNILELLQDVKRSTTDSSVPKVYFYPQQLFVCKEEVPPEQQEWSPSLDQEEPEPLHIKEEQEELFIQGLEEAEVPTLILLPENSDNNEEEQSSQLNPTQTDENREAEPPASTSIEQMKTEPDADDCGVSELVGNLEPAGDLEPVSDDQLLSSGGCETETEDSDDNDWKETREPQSCLNRLKSKKTQRVEGQSLSVSNKFRRSMEASNELKPSNQIPSLVGCKLCEKTFPSNVSLKRHAIVHSEGCGLCGKHFDSTENLKLHFEAHNTCSICSKKCCSISKLERHMRVHTRQKPFSCSVCEKCFSRTDILKIHMRSHTGEKPFSCTFCEKGFSLKDGLNKHLRCHTGEKPFSCSLCGQRFSVKSCLQKHMIVHTGEKPFSCSVCGKRFGQKYYLKTHRRLHTGEKPYGCSVCGKSFRWLSDVKSHKCVSESTSRGR